MNIRYQVFVSSTYRDLKEERKYVIDELNKVGFIAIGMENFPAADEEQMEYIRPLIDESDYYVVIVKAKYGSKAADGLSYTEKEFDYAISSGTPALAFLFNDNENLLISESEQDPDSFAKLVAFKRKLTEKRVVRFWASSHDLGSAVKDSLYDLVRRKPGLGWIRGNNAVDPKIYVQLSELKQENDELRKKLSISEESIVFPANIRHGEDEVDFEFFIVEENTDLENPERAIKIKTGPFDYKTTWDRLLKNLLDLLYSEPSEQAVLLALASRAKETLKLDSKAKIEFAKDPSRMIRFQFEALGIITTFNAEIQTNFSLINGRRTKGVHWRLSDLGKRYLSRLNAISK